MADDMDDEVREAVAELLGASTEGLDAESAIEFGWPELLEEDARLAVSELFEGMGRRGIASNVIDLVASDGATDAGDRVAVVYGGAFPVLPKHRGEAALQLAAGDEVSLDGLLAVGSSPDGPVLVIAGDLTRAVAIRVDAGGSAEVEAVEGIDPRSVWRTYRAANARVVDVADADRSAGMLGAVRRALAYEQLGVARGLLAIAVDHVSSRHQFGRALGSYQAVRHRLADVHVAIELAASALEFTWKCEASEVAYSASVAKSLASSAFRTAMTHSLQVCGGMGFTEEFPLAALIRRGLFLEPLFGDSAALDREIGAHVLRAKSVTRLASFARNATV